MYLNSNSIIIALGFIVIAIISFGQSQEVTTDAYSLNNTMFTQTDSNFTSVPENITSSMPVTVTSSVITTAPATTGTTTTVTTTNRSTTTTTTAPKNNATFKAPAKFFIFLYTVSAFLSKFLM